MDAIEEMEHIKRRIASYDARIKAYVDELCPNLLTIPGVDYVTAGLIAGETATMVVFTLQKALFLMLE